MHYNTLWKPLQLSIDVVFTESIKTLENLRWIHCQAAASVEHIEGILCHVI